MSDALAGSDWSEREIDLIVAGYFDMLGLEFSGQPFVKAQPRLDRVQTPQY